MAIDLPGHGLSYRIPDGVSYSYIDMALVLNELCEKYGWDQISIIAHSMGAIITFLYASLLPGKVNLVIAIDTLKPQTRPPRMIANVLQYKFQNFLQAIKYNRDKLSEPPSYTYPGLIERLIQGTSGSVEAKVAHLLLKRGVRPSKIYADKYYFTRDCRVKYIIDSTFDQETSLELARRITAKYLFIKTNDERFSEQKKHVNEAIDVMRKHTTIQVNYIRGTHHIHMNNPKRISGIISDFLNKHLSDPNTKQAKKIACKL